MGYQPNAEFNLFTDTETGDVFANKEGIYKLIGGRYKFYELNEFKGSVLFKPKKAQVPTAGGLQGSVLYTENAVKFAVKYYAKKGNETASHNLDIFLEVGIKVYIQNETGFNAAHESVMALFKQLRGYHKICHVQWQAKQEEEGFTPSEIAHKYIALFDRVSGLVGAYKMYKKLGAKTACDLLHPSILKKLDEELMK